MKIIIPFKETSVRCPDKNFSLFPFTYKWLKKQGVADGDITVTSSSGKVRSYVAEYGVRFVPETENAGDIAAAYLAARKMGIDRYMWIPLTQPLRQDGLMAGVSSLLSSSDCDFVTTYQKVTDRSLFYIGENSEFAVDSTNRRGSMCKEWRMIDGAIYGIKTSFIDKIIDSPDINASFWAGNFKTIENKADFFMDIDTESDMRKFSMLSSSYF